MWKHDIQDKPVTVSLSGKDLIVDTDAVRRYLTGENGTLHSESSPVQNGRSTRWKGDRLDVLWFGDLDHAQVFDLKKNRMLLGDVVREYCAQGK